MSENWTRGTWNSIPNYIPKELETSPRPSVNDTKFYMAEVMLALKNVHAYEVIYKGLKRENLLLDAEGHIVVTDFVRSKIPPDDETRGKIKFNYGTVETIAPEVLDSKSFDYRADYWSLGIFLYEFITGVSPYNPTGKFVRKSILQRIKKNEPKRDELFTADEWDLIQKLLKTDPKKRLGMWSL